MEHNGLLVLYDQQGVEVWSSSASPNQFNANLDHDGEFTERYLLVQVRPFDFRQSDFRHFDFRRFMFLAFLASKQPAFLLPPSQYGSYSIMQENNTKN